MTASDTMIAFFLRLHTPVYSGDAIATLSDKLVSVVLLKTGFPLVVHIQIRRASL